MPAKMPPESIEHGDTRLPARFWAKVTPTPDGCWQWTACVHAKGYGMFLVGRIATAAHRVAYEALVRPIPAGLVLDHTCHDPETCFLDRDCPHRRCVNPAHVAMVTPKANSDASRRANRNRRKTHCDKGHPFDESNTYFDENGKRRSCRICRREAGRRHDAKRRGKAVA